MHEGPRNGLQRYAAADRDRGGEEFLVQDPRSSEEHAGGVDGRSPGGEEFIGQTEGDRERRHLGFQAGQNQTGR